MAVGIGTATVGAIASSTISYTFSFVSTSQPLYCIVAMWINTGTLSTVTYGGTGLTRVAQSANSNGADKVEIWRLLAPSAGTANLVVTFSAGSTSRGGSAVIFNTTGQDVDGTPEGTPATNASTVNGTATGSLAISGAASGDMVIAGIANGAATAVTPASTGGTGLTEIMDAVNGGEGAEAFRVSDASTAVSGSWTTAGGWAIAAIPLKVAAVDPFPVAYRQQRLQPPNKPTLFAR